MAFRAAKGGILGLKGEGTEMLTDATVRPCKHSGLQAKAVVMLTVFIDEVLTRHKKSRRPWLADVQTEGGDCGNDGGLTLNECSLLAYIHCRDIINYVRTPRRGVC